MTDTLTSETATSAADRAPTVTKIEITTKKSVGLAILLTLLFGPLGMLYTTVWGAIIMLIVSAVVGFFSLGVGLLLTWPICVIWGAVAARKTTTVEGTATHS